MAKRPPILLLVALGALGLGGAAVAKIVANRRRQRKEETVKEAAPLESEGIRIKACPECGAEVKEYEFFCAACGKSFE
jgi:hypothetical protein